MTLRTGERKRGAADFQAWLFVCALCVIAAGCAQIVGIKDTVVVDAGSDVDAGSVPSEAGSGGPSAEGGSEASGSDSSPEVGLTGTDGGLDATTTSDATMPPDAAPDSSVPDSGNAGDARPPSDASPDQVSPDGGSCAACPVDHPTCQSGQCIVRGPTMVAAGALSDNLSAYYIDSTEVTVGQYKQFLAAKGSDTGGQPSICAWNKSYYDTSVPMKPDTWPITNVDWCDAVAFCSWAGKHLCGAIGGGPVASVDVENQSKSQWFRACGGPGGSPHPNSEWMCNSNGGAGDLLPVGTSPHCEGYPAGLQDMQGNAAEWVDSCDGTAGASDMCQLLGGSYIDQESYCTESFGQPRNSTAEPFGFRCCGG